MEVDARKVLVLTLYSGEAEFNASQNALKHQLGVAFEQHIFSNMENKAAHVALYEMIAAQSGAYDYFLKMDADMVLRSEQTLRKLVDDFEVQPNTDVMTWPVMDFFSNSNIYGIHMFSPRVRWDTKIPDTFVDPPPIFQGQKIIHPLTDWAYVAHAPLPSMRQAFEFGVHRGFKTFRAAGGNSRTMSFHLGILRRVWKVFQFSGDRARGLAMLGAEFVRAGRIQTANYRNNSQIDSFFDEACGFSRADIVKTCERFWTFEAPVLHTYNRLRSRLLLK